MIIQFVGYQNSGKTAAMTAVIKKLTAKGIRVVAIKHHGHGGVPDTIAKDSIKHREAGAIASVVEGDGVLHMEVARQQWTIEGIEALLSFFQYDVLLIEGYKKVHYPKVVFLRNELERKDFSSLSHVQYMIPWCQTIAEKESYIDEIVRWIEGKITCSK